MFIWAPSPVPTAVTFGRSAREFDHPRQLRVVGPHVERKAEPGEPLHDGRGVVGGGVDVTTGVADDERRHAIA